jgi:flagellin-like protein
VEAPKIMRSMQNGKFNASRARVRKAGRRGVSPIIATILLVAITVVLAAVLYVLISGLTSSTATAPISLAPAVNPSSTGGGGTTWYVAVGLNPSAGIATTQFGLKVTTSTTTATLSAAVGGTGCTVGSSFTTGATGCAGVTAKWYAVLTNATGKIVATYLSAGWSSSVTISGGSYTLYVMSATAYDGQGYTLSAYGTGSASVSGQVHL